LLTGIDAPVRPHVEGACGKWFSANDRQALLTDQCTGESLFEDL